MRCVGLYNEGLSVQRIVEKFNDDEEHWRRLEGLRRLMRELVPHLLEKDMHALDLLLFERTRPLDDCVGSQMR